MRFPFLRQFLILLPIPVLWCVVATTASFRALEERTLDWRFRYRGEVNVPAKIVYVDIDARSVEEIGGPPWSRSYYEQVARALVEQGGARAVGFCFLLSDHALPELVDHPRLIEGNLELARYLSTNPPVVLGAAFSAQESRDIVGLITRRDLPLIRDQGRHEEADPPVMPTLLAGRARWNAERVGLIDLPDEAARAIPLRAHARGGPYYHLIIELAREYWDVPPDGVRPEADRLTLVNRAGNVVAEIPWHDGQFMDVNWFTRWDSPHNVRESFSVVQAYARNLQADDATVRASAAAYLGDGRFRDAIVLIGAVDPLLQDLGRTPLDEQPVPTVSVHGNALKTILTGRYLWRPSVTVEWLTVFLLAGAVGGLAFVGGARAVWLKVAALVVTIGYVGCVLGLFQSRHWVLPLLAPLGAASTLALGAIVGQVVQERRAKARIRAMFGTYVAPEVVGQMVDAGDDPQLGGHDKEITAYFSDIEDFAVLSEQLTSSQLGELLTEYLTACTGVLQAERGTLDKYIGDAVVAMFGAPLHLPDHAWRACQAALDTQRVLQELRRKWEAEGEKWPEQVRQLRCRVGLHTGVCTIGNIGSATRFNYTMMGPNVNLAARMESSAKLWGVYTLATEATRAACVAAGSDIVFRPLGRMSVKGFAQPVEIAEVVGAEELDQSMLDGLELFRRGLERFQQRDWEGARNFFERSARLERWQPGCDPRVRTNPSLVYQALIRMMVVQPPAENWDGRCELNTQAPF